MVGSLVNAADVAAQLASTADPERMCFDLMYKLVDDIGVTIGVTSGGMEKLRCIPSELNEAVFHVAEAPDANEVFVTTPYFELARLHRARKAKRDAERYVRAASHI